MRIIDLEAHFITHGFYDFVNAGGKPPRVKPVRTTLYDVGEGRLSAMDTAGITMQVLSFTLTIPRLQDIEADEAMAWSRKANDDLAEIIKNHPDRFAGISAIPAQSPNAAADEIDRAVSELKLKGVSLQSHAGNEYLDDRKFWPIFDKAEKLGVPVYLHPTTPSTAILRGFDPYGTTLNTAASGFGIEVSLHVMRLIYSGVFDKFPGLKIILGHMGEGLPFNLYRMDFQFLKQGYERPKIDRRPSEYFKDNFVVTTSGVFFQPALICTLLALGSSNIAFAVDYPFESNTEAVEFVKIAAMSDDDKEQIFHKTAETLFKI